ncbi:MULTISPECIES: DUF5990 family protein [unclassified Novosphingobium]|uniref:DUF5990 family protein n=1 Tax=unclassified Novosphingobium TaxID=2644732 RepID=UPI00146A181D|nr:MULTISPECIES: DUF5990 family protein [unclassified Novosphingobium]NMN02952.1 hypothetical protein [Novosphingobium sp. SG919]NMN87061.1 hypothetical protein [Novosphingobium sp. SG916]
MKRTDTTEIAMRIVIDRPVPGVRHSLQSKDGHPLDAAQSSEGEALAFDFAVRVGPGPRFFGDQVRAEGPIRRFVYVRVGQAAGDPASPWSRRMKIDIHDIAPELLARAKQGGIIVSTVCGTGKDGSPACATVPVLHRVLVAR